MDKDERGEKRLAAATVVHDACVYWEDANSDVAWRELQDACRALLEVE